MNYVCRKCEWSEGEYGAWRCTHGYDPEEVSRNCDGFWCCERDKVNGIKHRESRCLICGRPIYSTKQAWTPIYCWEHREYAKRDDEIIANAPMELLQDLIVAIFFRAREDYVANISGQRSDAEIFVRSSWGQKLSMGGYDPDELLEAWRESERP